jgi:two-component system, cell cycle sensor histidine kinase and response regulator CckA
VKQSGGHINISSERGCGAKFEVYLPHERHGVAVAAAKPKTKTELSGDETVLFVEDEDGVRSLGRLVLEQCGYKILEARNGVDALAICEKFKAPIHLLATDVVMPKMSGRELAERLKMLRPEIEVLYLSGYMDDAVIRHGVSAASVPFLQKPFTPVALAQKVREVLDQAAAEPCRSRAVRVSA